MTPPPGCQQGYLLTWTGPQVLIIPSTPARRESRPGTISPDHTGFLLVQVPNPDPGPLNQQGLSSTSPVLPAHLQSERSTHSLGMVLVLLGGSESRPGA